MANFTPFPLARCTGEVATLLVHTPGIIANLHALVKAGPSSYIISAGVNVETELTSYLVVDEVGGLRAASSQHNVATTESAFNDGGAWVSERLGAFFTNLFRLNGADDLAAALESQGHVDLIWTILEAARGLDASAGFSDAWMAAMQDVLTHG